MGFGRAEEESKRRNSDEGQDAGNTRALTMIDDIKTNDGNIFLEIVN